MKKILGTNHNLRKEVVINNIGTEQLTRVETVGTLYEI